MPIGTRPVGIEYPIILDFGVEYSKSLIKRLSLKHTFHRGIDFASPSGTPCLAYRDGIIQIAHDNDDGLGKRVWLYCDLPKEKKAIRVCYAHLSRIAVKVGQRVKEGDIIGLSGETGKVEGPHLHFEARFLPEDEPFRPNFYFQGDV